MDYGDDKGPLYYCGHLANFSRELDITTFKPQEDQYAFVMNFGPYNEYRPLKITFTYSSDKQASLLSNFASAADDPKLDVVS